MATTGIKLADMDLSPLYRKVAELLAAVEKYNQAAIDWNFKQTITTRSLWTSVVFRVLETEQIMLVYAPALKTGDLLPAMDPTPHEIAHPFMELYEVLREARQGDGECGQAAGGLWLVKGETMPDTRQVVSMLRRIVEGLNEGSRLVSKHNERERTLPTRDNVGSERQDMGGWEILRHAPREGQPPPDTGKYVIALDPPAIDGNAELQGVIKEIPGQEHFALLWKNKQGSEVLHPLNGCLLMGCQNDATWLPENWKMDVFPTGWTLPHLEQWFRYALNVAGDDETHNTRGDIPRGSDKSPSYYPTPRALVTHAHLIVRHLRLVGSPREPRGPMDRSGCLAELNDLLLFFRRTLTAGEDCSPLKKVNSQPTPIDSVLQVDAREVSLEAPVGMPPVLKQAYEAVADALFQAAEMRRSPPTVWPIFEDQARALANAREKAARLYAEAETLLLPVTDPRGQCVLKEAQNVACKVNDAVGHIMLKIVPFQMATEHVQTTPAFDLGAILRAMRRQVSLATHSLPKVDATPMSGHEASASMQGAADSPAKQPRPVPVDHILDEATRRQGLLAKLRQIEERLEKKRTGVVQALISFSSTLKNVEAGQEQVSPVFRQAALADSLLHACRAIRDGEFSHGIELILDGDRQDAAGNTRLAIDLYRRAWNQDRQSILNLLERLDQLPMHRDSFDPAAPSRQGVWDAVRGRFDVIIPFPPSMGTVHPWHPDMIEGLRLQVELSPKRPPEPEIDSIRNELVLSQISLTPTATLLLDECRDAFDHRIDILLLPGMSYPDHYAAVIGDLWDKAWTLGEVDHPPPPMPTVETEIQAKEAVAALVQWIKTTFPADDLGEQSPRAMANNAPLTSVQPAEKPQDSWEYSIQRIGETWEICFAAERGHYSSKCVGQLAKILSHPNRTLTVTALLDDSERKLEGDANLRHEQETDAEGIRAINRRLQDLDEIAAVTGGRPDLEDEKLELTRKLQNASRQLPSALGNAHHNIATQIRKLIKKLKTDMPALGAHLKATLKMDKPNFGYFPNPRIDWKI